jgi:uncharacterized protein with NRDE domain
MCLISFGWKAHPRYRLVLIANRDEFHARPTAPAQAWADAPALHGGRDLRQGGSWLLVSARDRVAAVTNVRNGREAADPQALSRGALVDEFVRGSAAPSDWLAQLSTRAARYGPFNLLLGAGEELHFASNRPHFRHRPLQPGVHALSNGDFDEGWPKTRRASAALAAWLDTEGSMDARPPLQPLWTALADRRIADDFELPDTGIAPELERRLSAAFIVGEEYGTRASTLLLMDAAEVALHERRFGPGGSAQGESILRFALAGGESRP